MSHYAEIKDGIVERVIVADSKEWCETNLSGEWVQTSYNTQGGEHKLGGTPLHKNYAGIGYTWDGIGFALPQPFDSWTLDAETYLWQAPTLMPTDDKMYSWNEEDLAWEEIATLG